MSQDVGIHNAYAELSTGDSGLLLDLKEAVDLLSGVVEITSLNPEQESIVKFTAVDTYFDTISTEEYVFIQNLKAPVINQFIVYSSVMGTISVGVDVFNNYGLLLVPIAFLHWKGKPNTQLDRRGVPQPYERRREYHVRLDVNSELTCIDEVLV